MNPNYLLKDELLYELGIRGITSEGDIASLRKLFRSSVARNLPIDVYCLKGLQLEALYSTILEKTLELQTQVTQPTADVASFTTRSNTRIAHLRGRIQHLQDMALHAGDFDSAKIQVLGENLDAVEKTMGRVCVERPQFNLGAGTSGDPCSTAEPIRRHSMSEVMPQQQAQDTAEVRMPSFSSGTVPGSLYQKLPHPLAPLFKNLPVSDGSDIPVLYDLLLQVIKLRQVGLIVEPPLFELLYPCCQGELVVLLTKALTLRETFDFFHERVLLQFIPSRQLGQLRVELYERVQREGESLSAYIQSVKDAALVLRIKESESEVVNRILEGLTMTQIARFVFQAPPKNFEQLEHLVVVDRNMAYAEGTRQPRSMMEGEMVAGRGVVAAIDHHAGTKSSTNQASSPSNRPVCYYCGRVGHIQRNCSVYLARRGRSRNDRRSRP
jgi:hypothetical protein